MKRIIAALAALAALCLLSLPACADSLGSAVGGAAGNQSSGAGCIFQTPALTAGQQATLSCDSSGHLITATSGSAAVSPTSTAALAANLVVSAAPSTLHSFNVSADSTLSGAAWWVMIYNLTAAPADGAVTPTKCYALPSGSTGISGAFVAPITMSTGIVIGVSTTGCFTKTASTHAFISGE